MIDYADVIVDLAYGDSGKGKVTHALSRSKLYTHCIRYNGSNNAGHTIYHEGKKIVTHSIPTGVVHGIKSIIGPGCVMNVKQFFDELKELQDAGVKTEGLVYIAAVTVLLIVTNTIVKEYEQNKSQNLSHILLIYMKNFTQALSNVASFLKVPKDLDWILIGAITPMSLAPPVQLVPLLLMVSQQTKSETFGE